jgi:X-Pro dipeptidyl-peptidase
MSFSQVSKNRIYNLIATVAVSVSRSSPLASLARSGDHPVAVFEDGQAQVVPAFESLRNGYGMTWVETEFDSDGDGKLDRMHVDVTRQSKRTAKA